MSVGVAEVTMLMDRGLTPAEKIKFDRLQDQIWAIFSAAGFPDVRLCEAMGRDNDRLIGFVRGLFGPPLVSVPAARFLAASDDEVLQGLEKAINRR